MHLLQPTHTPAYTIQDASATTHTHTCIHDTGCICYNPHPHLHTRYRMHLLQPTPTHLHTRYRYNMTMYPPTNPHTCIDDTGCICRGVPCPEGGLFDAPLSIPWAGTPVLSTTFQKSGACCACCTCANVVGGTCSVAACVCSCEIRCHAFVEWWAYMRRDCSCAPR